MAQKWRKNGAKMTQKDAKMAPLLSHLLAAIIDDLVWVR
jgi:hypothetical protein